MDVENKWRERTEAVEVMHRFSVFACLFGLLVSATVPQSKPMPGATNSSHEWMARNYISLMDSSGLKRYLSKNSFSLVVYIGPIEMKEFGKNVAVGFGEELQASTMRQIKAKLQGIIGINKLAALRTMKSSRSWAMTGHLQAAFEASFREGGTNFDEPNVFKIKVQRQSSVVHITLQRIYQVSAGSRKGELQMYPGQVSRWQLSKNTPLRRVMYFDEDINQTL